MKMNPAQNSPSVFITASLLFIMLIFYSGPAHGQYTQTVRGKVTDKVTSAPLPGVTVILNDRSLNIGTITGSEGEFTFTKVPIGRNSFMFTFIGYEAVQIKDIVVSSGKEVFLPIEMTEKVEELEQVVIRAYKKGEVINKMASISARSFSVEETEHFAGSWSDPARMATNFAGVASGNDTRNDIVIRGNSPNGLLWRLEGVDIPNPNHFAVQGSSGGPVCMLNSNLLTRSDFFTGAFPAQYGNAIAGVFDLNMRNGNTEKNEFILQTGLNGYEVGIEGPFAKNYGGSYMINGRYSFLDILQKMGFNIVGGAVPTYSDLNFKIFLPIKNFGKITLFGLGGLDNIKAPADKSTDQFNPVANSDLSNKTATGVVGIGHVAVMSEKTKLHTTFSVSTQRTNIAVDSIMPDLSKELYYSSNFTEKEITLSTQITHKINTKSTISFGVSLKDKGINQNDSAMYLGSYLKLITLENDHLQLLQGFIEWKHRFTSNFSFYSGLHSQYLFLNGSKTVEPRLGLSLNISNNQTINFGYGIHSQTQSLPVYFAQSANADRTAYWRTCENLDFTTSQHYIFGYNNKLSENWNFKMETYLQDLWKIPIERTPSNFSVVNLGATYFNGTQEKDSLINKGHGKNYGVEMTLERYLNQNWYFFLTSSLFESLYFASDRVWRNSVFSTRFVNNALLGFEFPISKRSSLDFNLRLVWSGGLRQKFINKEASIAAGIIIYDEDKIYSEQAKDYMKLDYKMTLRHNMRKATVEFAIDIANLTDQRNIFSQSFNPKTGHDTFTYQQGFLPTALLRVTF
jgi:hypothetical protein